ncbi:hypothetical protein C8T65DRAFT_665894 [Cerioporus squamosus]|nr:hypothetical protein C8T65DRAFT_665894 [Cerioporus squamosus]
MHRLPYDVQLSIVRLLSTRDILRLCATCKALQALLTDRSVWHRALSRLLLRFPQPHLSRRLQKLTVEELKHQVLQAARLDRLWHALDYHPKLIRNFHRDRTVEHVSLVAGGNWLIIVLYDGSLQLQELDAQAPAVTLSPSLTEDESIIYLSSFLSLTNDHEDVLILQMGVRYNQCNIYVYQVAVVEPSPAFVLIGKISVTGSVWCCASGGQLLVYGLESGGGDMILHVCPVGPQYTASGARKPQVSLNIGPWSADEDFTISVLSEHQLMLAYHGGIFIYEIPPLSAVHPPPSPENTGEPGPPPIHSVRPVWSCRCDIGSGIYHISPFSWSAGTGLGDQPQKHPLVIAGTRALHVIRVYPDSRVDYREIPYPLVLGAEIGYIGLGAVGVRRAIWDCTETRNGSLHVHFRTYSLPRSILDISEDDPDYEPGELWIRGKLGSFSVTLNPEEHLVNLCLEESSGRVCLLLNNITTGTRRIAVIDAV